MRGVRTKVMQWSMRLLKEEVSQHPAGSMGGPPPSHGHFWAFYFFGPSPPPPPQDVPFVSVQHSGLQGISLFP